LVMKAIGPKEYNPTSLQGIVLNFTGSSRQLPSLFSIRIKNRPLLLRLASIEMAHRRPQRRCFFVCLASCVLRRLGPPGGTPGHFGSRRMLGNFFGPFSGRNVFFDPYFLGLPGPSPVWVPAGPPPGSSKEAWFSGSNITLSACFSPLVVRPRSPRSVPALHVRASAWPLPRRDFLGSIGRLKNVKWWWGIPRPALPPPSSARGGGGRTPLPWPSYQTMGAPGSVRSL